MLSKTECSSTNITCNFNERLKPIEEATIKSSLVNGKSDEMIDLGGIVIKSTGDVKKQMQRPIMNSIQPLFAEIQSAWLGLFRPVEERVAVRGAEYTRKGLMTSEAKLAFEEKRAICDGSIAVRLNPNPELEELNDYLKMAEIIMQNGEMPNRLAEKLKDPKVFDKVAKYIGDVKLDQSIKDLFKG